MIPFDTIVVAPLPEGSPARQAGRALATLESRLRASGRDRDDVLALTLFVAPGDAAGWSARRRELVGVVRDRFDGDPPATTVVAQAPHGRRAVAVEAVVLAAPAAVARRTVDGVRCTVVTGGGVRQVLGGGIGGAGPDMAARSAAAFASMAEVLRRERMEFGHVVRQWSYLEGTLDVGADGRQGYQAFNDVRAAVYARSAFPAGYPAATGIGQAAGGVVLSFLALDAPRDVAVAPLSNPRQTDAHRYSVGRLAGGPAPCTPKFERAKRIRRAGEEVVLVSGTAAIVGEESVGPGDVAAQARTTIENIRALVGERPLASLRAYARRPSDLRAVRRLCESAFGRIPAVYVTADVCRDELLVELEGTVVARVPVEVGGP